jgi:hypothetical protein
MTLDPNVSDTNHKAEASHQSTASGFAAAYLTDGTHLYEIAAQRVVANYGLARGSFRYVIIRDCVSEATSRVDELQLAALTEVRRGVPGLMQRDGGSDFAGRRWRA